MKREVYFDNFFAMPNNLFPTNEAPKIDTTVVSAFADVTAPPVASIMAKPDIDAIPRVYRNFLKSNLALSAASADRPDMTVPAPTDTSNALSNAVSNTMWVTP